MNDVAWIETVHPIVGAEVGGSCCRGDRRKVRVVVLSAAHPHCLLREMGEGGEDPL